MRVVLRITTCLFVCLLALQVSAQNKKTAKADTEYANGAYMEAADSYKMAADKLKKDINEKGRCLFRIGECYRQMTMYAESEEWYRKSITAKYEDENAEVLFSYGEALRMQGKYDEAVVQYQKYMENFGDKDKAEEVIASCEEIVNWIEVPPTRYLVEQEVILNTGNFDYSPMYSSKKYDEMVISTSRESTEGKGKEAKTDEPFMDLFITTMDKNGKWKTPEPLNNTVNTKYSEGTATFDKKFKVMYFSRCINDGDERTGCDIYYAKRNGDKFGPAEPINLVQRTTEEEDGDDSTNFAHPAMAPDDSYMIFSSNLKGGFGGTDLWMIKYDKKAKAWGKPVNLGKEINTTANEVFPYIHADGSLYFSTDGLMGMGGFDIYRAESTGEEQWGNPINLQYPINSSADDFGIVYNKDEDAGFFSSNRSGGKGKDDVYSFRMPPLEFNYQGIVYDALTSEPLPNTRVVITESPGGASYDLVTDGNGGVVLNNGEILEESTYALSLSNDQGKPVYIAQKDQFTTVGLTESTSITREYFLDPVIEEKEYKMPLVLYPFAKWNLLVNDTVNSEDSLSFLYNLMVENPTFVVQLESHTDSRGGTKANQILSQKRAQTCVDYLVGRGIDKERLVAKGRGEYDLKIKDAEINAATTEEEKERLHQINRRTVFKIIRYDYKPKE